MSGANGGGAATTLLLTIEVDQSQFDAFAQQFQHLKDNFTLNMRPSGGGMGGMGGGGSGGIIPFGPTGSGGGSNYFAQMNNSLRQTQVNVTNINTVMSTMNAIVGNTTNNYTQQNNILNRQQSILRGNRTIWGSIARDARHTGDSILGILRWGGGALLGIGLGLAGAAGGSLYGLDKLGENVVSTRRAAMGVGASYGGLRASQMDYGQYINADSLLGNIASTRNDLSKRWILGEAGLSDDQINNQTTDQLSQPMLKWLRGQWQSSHGNQQLLDATGATSLMGMSDLRTIGTMSPDEFSQMLSHQAQDTKALGVGRGTQDAWSEFTRNLDLAGAKIDTALIKGLEPLTPELSKLATGIADAVGGFLSNPHIKEDINDLAEGLSKAGAYLHSEDFGADLKKAGDSIAAFGKSIEGSIETLKGWDTWVHTNLPWLFQTPQEVISGAEKSASGAATSAAQGADDWLARHSGLAQSNIETNIASKLGVDSKFQNSIFRIESGNNPAIGVNPKSGATGVGQILPGTFGAYAKFGDTDINNFDQNVDASTREMLEDLKWSGGDPLIAGAAYNAGRGNAGVIKFKTSHNISDLPYETQQYVKSLQTMGFDFGQNSVVGGPSSFPTYDGSSSKSNPATSGPGSYPTYPTDKKRMDKLKKDLSTYGHSGDNDLSKLYPLHGTEHWHYGGSAPTLKGRAIPNAVPGSYRFTPPGIHLTIDNRAGSDLSVSAGQLA